MAIKVKLTDGTVQVGGNFDSAKNHVKALGGKFDGQIKIWNLNQSVQEFSKATPYPIDILSSDSQARRYQSGNHITRYGNAYSQNEWEGQKASDKAMADAAGKFEPAVQAARKAADDYLKNALQKFNPANGMRIYNLLQNPVYGFHGWELAVEDGRLAFRSDESKAQFSAIMAEYDRLENEWLKACEAQDEAAHAAQERVMEEYGIE